MTVLESPDEPLRRYYLLGVIPLGPWGQWDRHSVRWLWRFVGVMRTKDETSAAITSQKQGSQ